MNATRQPVIRIRPVAAGRGVDWWSESFSWMFGSLSNFGIWLVLALFVMVSAMLLSAVMFIGSIAATLIWFFFEGGLMKAAQRTAAGEPAGFADLAAGFGPASAPLAGAAILTVLVGWVVAWLFVVVEFETLLSTAISTLLSTPPVDFLPALLDFLQTYLPTALERGLLCVLPLVPLQMAVWLAPALIVLSGAPLGESLRLSFMACIRNSLAVFVYGLCFIGLAVFATLALGAGWFVLLPLTFLSTYAAYRDMFEASLEVLDAAPAVGG